jgi:rod shape-determining protein MreD
MTAVRLAAVLLSALVLQATLVADLRFQGVSVDVLLVIAIAAGLTGGSDRGAVIGFVAGVGMDLLLDTPFGLSALSYCLVGYVSGTLQDTTERAAWWFPVPVAVAAGALGVTVFVVGGEVAGAQLLSTPGLWRVVVVVAAACGLMILPANRLLRWCFVGPTTTRAAVT